MCPPFGSSATGDALARVAGGGAEPPGGRSDDVTPAALTRALLRRAHPDSPPPLLVTSAPRPRGLKRARGGCDRAERTRHAPPPRPTVAGDGKLCDSVEAYLYHHAHVATHRHAVTRLNAPPLVPEAVAHMVASNPLAPRNNGGPETAGEHVERARVVVNEGSLPRGGTSADDRSLRQGDEAGGLDRVVKFPQAEAVPVSAPSFCFEVQPCPEAAQGEECGADVESMDWIDIDVAACESWIPWLNNAALDAVDKHQNLQVAIGYLNYALQLNERCDAQSPERDNRASILHNNAANVLFNQGLCEESLEHYVNALNIEARVGAKASAVAALISNIAIVYCTMGRVEEAVLHWRRSLEITRAANLGDDMDTVHALRDMASALRQSNLLPNAEADRCDENAQEMEARLNARNAAAAAAWPEKAIRD